MSKRYMYWDGVATPEERYYSNEGHTMAREPEFFNHWVLRAPTGEFVGHNQYRNDLCEHNNFEIAY